jgi:excisionase family DNA binding protein
MEKTKGIIKLSIRNTDDVLLFDNNSELSPLLTIPEVARLLKVSVSGVRRILQQRCLPFIKVGGSIRLLKEDVAAYLRKQRVEIIG